MASYFTGNTGWKFYKNSCELILSQMFSQNLMKIFYPVSNNYLTRLCTDITPEGSPPDYPF